jgi:hypothetical protein
MACIDIEISPSPLDGQRDGLLRPYTVDLGARVPGLQPQEPPGKGASYFISLPELN